MLINCEFCNIQFNKKNSEIKRVKHHYCSRSCAGKANHNNAKRKPLGNCKKCFSSIPSNRSYCKMCRKPLKLHPNVTLEELLNTKGHRSSIYNSIRDKARRIAKKLGWKQCINCGYNKHYNVCHIKPIHLYPKPTLVSEINSISNLICLCPNCHWELDNGLLKM